MWNMGESSTKQSSVLTVVNLDGGFIHFHNEFYPTDTLWVCGWFFAPALFHFYHRHRQRSRVRQVCADVLPNFMGKNRQSFLMYKLLTRTPMRFSYSHGTFASFISFFFVSTYFCRFLCSVPWLLPVLCSRGGYNTQTHSFYCEKFKFIWVYSLEILTSAVHCCWCQALLTRCKYVCVYAGWQWIEKSTWVVYNSILQAENHRRYEIMF